MNNPRQTINYLSIPIFIGIIPVLFGHGLFNLIGLLIILPTSIAILVLQIKYRDVIKNESLSMATEKGLNTSPEAISRRKKYLSGLLAIFIGGVVFSFLGIFTGSDFALIFLVVSSLIFVFGLIGMTIADHAERKGKSWETFFWLSVLVSPVLMGIIVAVIGVEQGKVVAGTKKCPKCAEVVKEEAILCKHCGSDLS